VPPNKLFALAPVDRGVVQLTVKVTPEEREVALALPFVSVARYVGRYGWITAAVSDEESLAAALEWLRESYWLKAPKKIRDAAWS
jgi:predicted DNA-binding protein (MmcQ/YjbR family)